MKTYKVLPQIVVALIAFGGSFIYGILIGWSSPAALSILSTENSFHVSTHQFGWMVALMPAGVASSCIPSGIIRSRIGTKLTVLIFGVFGIIGWMLTLLALNPGMIIAGRYFCGLGAGCYSYVIPIYVGEIASKEIRGKILSMFVVTVDLGILFVFVIGNYTTLLVLNIMCASVPLIYTMAFQFLPESQAFYITKNKEIEAMHSLKILRGESYNPQFEIDILKKDHALLLAEKKNFAEIFKTKSTRKAFMIVIILFFFFQLSGYNPILSYTSIIFKNGGIVIDIGIATTIVACVQLIASLFTFFIIDRFGRRKLLIVSNIVNCLALTGIATYFVLKENGQNVADLGWLPITSLCLFISSFSVGVAPVTYIMMGELFIQDAKAYVAPIGQLFNSTISALVTLTFPMLTGLMESGPTFFMFTAFCMLAFIFSVAVVPETKGKTTTEIQQVLCKGKS